MTTIGGFLALVVAPVSFTVGACDLGSLFLLVSVSTCLASGLNLVLVVKPDGYIALTTYPDLPLSFSSAPSGP